MALFLVYRTQGSDWRPGTGFDQHAFAEHEAFIADLVQQGVVKLAGPLEDGSAMLIMEAADKAQIHAILAPDPWSEADILPVTRIVGWTVRLGRL